MILDYLFSSENAKQDTRTARGLASMSLPSSDSPHNCRATLLAVFYDSEGYGWLPDVNRFSSITL